MKKVVLALAAVALGANLCAAQAEEIALDCQITLKSGKTYKAHIETDGIGLTIRQDDGGGAYFTNSSDGGSEHFLRLTPSEITYGSTYSIEGTVAHQETVINRNTGELISNRAVNLENMPGAQVGHCEKAATTPKKF